MSLRKVLLVDLDGTLLSTNTFHKYIFFIAKYYFKKNLFKTFVILFFVSARLARVISHSKLKYNLLKLSQDLPEEIVVSFGKSLMKYKNQSVSQIIVNYEGLKVLASAAPEKYTKSLGEHFNFDITLSTKNPGDNSWIENIKENKKSSLLDYLNYQDLEKQFVLDVIVTDHHDDLPLMEIFDKIILVNPSQETLTKTQHLKSKTQIIH